MIALDTLYLIIEKQMYEAGLKYCKEFRNDTNLARFVINDSDVYMKQLDAKYSTQAYYGNWIEVKQVFHRNQARFNTSYYLSMTECKRSSSHIIPGTIKLKLSCRQTEATTIKKITKFIIDYKQVLNEIIVMNKIEQLLK